LLSVRHERTADAPSIDLSFRPDYWEPSDIRQALLSNVKGELRRQNILRDLESGELDTLSGQLSKTTLSKRERERVGRIHPALMSGEYLPNYASGEIEIARVLLASATGDVIAVRAKRRGEVIRYRAEDEHGTRYRPAQSQSPTPLTCDELIRLIDGARIVGEKGYGLVFFYLDVHVRGTAEPKRAAHRQALRHFIRVRSDFYPDLERYYEERIEQWVRTGIWATVTTE
jgi:hypothetical protein